MTPAAAFILGVLAAWLVAVLTGLLWWLDARRTMRLVVAFAVQALADGLDGLAAALGGDAARQEVDRCRQLCAAVLRLVRQ